MPRHSVLDRILKNEIDRFVPPKPDSPVPSSPERSRLPDQAAAPSRADLDVTAGVRAESLAVGGAPFFDMARVLGGMTRAAGSDVNVLIPEAPGGANVDSPAAPADVASGLESLRDSLMDNADLFTNAPTDPGPINGDD
jgi:hypothetical protein